jgi:hypothetical protein
MGVGPAGEQVIYRLPSSPLGEGAAVTTRRA